ncbi:MAG TPA: N-acetylmuramoyl-L-alanine amidase, partial [Acidimicrobiaceae bacterium]|nr:N-acetylmuramoyl-L-alanine amidase [Acidimicrobiaceae bacterium]
MTRRSAAITVATVVLMSACAGQGALEPVGAPTNNAGTAAPSTTTLAGKIAPPTTTLAGKI